LVETSKVDPVIYDWVTTHYVKDRTRNQISVKAIVTTGDNTPIYTERDKAELRQTKVVSKSNFPFEQEINIYDDKIAIINHKAGEKLLGIIINDPSTATTFRSWFELTWKNI